MPPRFNLDSAALSDKDRILVVDDNISNLRVISELLDSNNFELSIATSGERALTQVKAFEPDLIILDIMMPEMGGFETCQRIKADEQTRDIPVIFMTALADVDSKVKGLSLGTVDYITKPFHAEEVLARINIHLAHQKTKRQLQVSENRLKASEKRLNDILESLKEVVWSASLEPFKFSFLSQAVESIYGISVNTLLQNPTLWIEMIHDEDRDLVCEQLISSQPAAQHQKLEYRIIRADGDERWVSCQYKAHIDPLTEQRCLDGIVQDISERKRAELKLLFRAHHDTLTKLANRAYFIKRLEQRLRRPRAHESKLFGLLFIDLDGFKSINDSLGHHIGDQLLVAVSERLLESVRVVDLVARLGGDEFTILIQQIKSSEQIFKTCDRIIEHFKAPFNIAGQQLSITASIGIALNNHSYDSADEMMRDADFAMYQAKDLGKDCFQLFNGKMHQEEVQKIQLKADLKQALENDEFILDYQPIFHLTTQKLRGFEALVRWQHPSRGRLSPTHFIPVAEEIGLMPKLGTLILRKACQQIQQWQQLTSRLSGLKISVNLSSHQLQEPFFLETVRSILTETKINPTHLQLEITESSLISNSDVNLKMFNALQKQGIQLSLDDFGTGYSSLSYLHKFPIDVLKIDRSFIQNMQSGTSSFEIVRTIISLTRCLNTEVVAEGVETKAQVKHLQSLDCEMVQGYYFSKPLTAEIATSYLKDGKTTACKMN